jgi:hypothetical protein
MADGDDINQPIAIRDPVHHAPFAYPNPPKICSTLQLHDSGRTGISHQPLNALEDPAGDLGIKVLEFFTR